MKILWIACFAAALTSSGLAAATFQSTSEQLNKSRQELSALLTTYTDQHPLVAAKREQISKLERALVRLQLEKAHEELNDLLTKYTNQHPLVVAKQEQIARLQATVALQRPEQAAPAPVFERARELQKALEELNDLLMKYTDLHPLVVAKQQQILALKKNFKSD